mgnify:CR=1 FL=1|jgi:hypothetical protein
MEALNDRFNALQETLLDIYESGKDDIDTQILHWNCLRKEQILLHYARKHGIRRVGYQHVPPLAVTETKAKEAIGMVLVLESLKKSPYGSESWTLVNTSLRHIEHLLPIALKKDLLILKCAMIMTLKTLCTTRCGIVYTFRMLMNSGKRSKGMWTIWGPTIWTESISSITYTLLMMLLDTVKQEYGK